MSTHIIRDYDGCRPIYEPAVYIHLFRAQSIQRKPKSFLQRLGALVRSWVTTTRNK